ncbi:PQQ-like beta-propeller repeat protein [Halorarum salinum]|uniref:PQQ-like beta-propeller repeat protein n=1 Tax=Halorarum salinum TaxID=2743089 RepID=A0A7D5QJS4_9EURY|nr:PQQ-like beta-propeller repeat protein [Halobaculum salinum]QLG61605.1 PQQ-like beta-propeller repeat protein [Halobaculum salinum]
MGPSGSRRPDRTNSVPLGELEPARTRSLSRRSGVLVVDDAVVTGLADGRVLAVDPGTLATRWTADADGGAVSLAPFDGGVAAGGRDPDGTVRVIDGGTVRWTYAASDDVGGPRVDADGDHPFVVDAVAEGDRLFVAVRRASREGDSRAYSSVVLAFDPAGEVRWRYGSDACVSALSVRDGRLAVAYNRCPGDHDAPAVVLDPVRGTELMRWGVGTSPDERRVGDVALLPEGVVAIDYGDHRGYVLDGDGTTRWRADLATPREVDGETVYAHPTAVHGAEAGVAFVTGSTYPRAAESLHPHEHRIRCFSPAGEHRRGADVRGLTRELGVDGGLVLVPSAQNMWTRDPRTHGFQLFDLVDGEVAAPSTEGIVTAASLSDGRFAAVEEPIRYHDEAVTRGAYRLHVGRVPEGR